MPHQLSLVVGLGNPGSKYDGTRHNIGFMALERLARREGFSFRQQAKLHGLSADKGFGDQRLRLLMPQTFMNDSGRSVRAALDWYGFQPEEIVLLVDDMDLPLGRLRLRAQGSAGGHNGLRSTIQHLGTQVFPRLRIGIAGRLVFQDAGSCCGDRCVPRHFPARAAVTVRAGGPYRRRATRFLLAESHTNRELHARNVHCRS